MQMRTMMSVSEKQPYIEARMKNREEIDQD